MTPQKKISYHISKIAIFQNSLGDFMSHISGKMLVKKENFLLHKNWIQSWLFPSVQTLLTLILVSNFKGVFTNYIDNDGGSTQYNVCKVPKYGEAKLKNLLSPTK